MRASRGGSLALPAFLGPTHENLFLTSTLPPFLAESGQKAGPIWREFEVGLMQFGSNATPAVEIWVDEVALDTARIGCDN
jgi:hypothetical protein